MKMFIVFQKQGSMQDSQEVSFMHTATSVKIPKNYLGNSLSAFYYTCEELAKLAGYDIEDVQLGESEIVIQFGNTVFDTISSLKELNQLWDEVNEACKWILPAYGCNEWLIELGIYEEEDAVVMNL
jgi:hypothetical protein